MVVIRAKGNFSKATNYLEKLKQAIKLRNLDKYGREGVQALSSMTPIDSGLTASSWNYEIVHDGDSVSIIFNNTHVNKGVNIALILQLRTWD